MASIALVPFLEEDGTPPDGVILTTVLPGGCQLDCPYCVLKMRAERRVKSGLTPELLSGFADSLYSRGALAGGAIVGDEPLQSHAWPYTGAFLKTMADLGTPSAIVTNGLELDVFWPQLAELEPSRIFVSLDAVGAQHDKFRRFDGAFSRIDSGIRKALSSSKLRDRLSIATILMPGNADDVKQLIKYAGSTGIAKIVLSPLATFTEGKPVRVHPRVAEHGWRSIQNLSLTAADCGVELMLSDEFAKLGEAWEATVHGKEVFSPSHKPRLVRLDPAGKIATYDQIRKGLPRILSLPESVEDLGSFADEVIGLFPENSDAIAA